VAYDPTVVVIDGIDGGTTPEFSFAPLANHASFATGSTTVSAFQSASIESPTGTVDVMHHLQSRCRIDSSITIDLVPQTGRYGFARTAHRPTSCTAHPRRLPTPTPAMVRVRGDCDGTRRTIAERRGVNIAWNTA
jgi:hypothetical protein